jgi:hypothetical protein
MIFKCKMYNPSQHITCLKLNIHTKSKMQEDVLSVVRIPCRCEHNNRRCQFINITVWEFPI